MQLLTFKTAGGQRLGLKTAAGVVDVAAAQAVLGQAGRGRAPESMAELLAGGKAALAALEALALRTAASAGPPGGPSDGTPAGAHAWLLDEAALDFAPCVPNPGKIFLVGRNYRKHAAETGHEVSSTPTLFSKFSSALAGHGEEIPLPHTAERFDYEGELAAVIGCRARYVAEDQALAYVLGYTVGNDLSARDLQFQTSQWLLGKTLDKFLPLGPYLTTTDEVGDPQDLDIRTWLNDELRQSANTSDMVYTVAHLVGYISQYLTLEPGDIIVTGTPQGVIDGRAEKVWMKPGDVVTVEVEKVGRLRNRLVAEG